jgi:luciferase family oxidoreductase group 1
MPITLGRNETEMKLSILDQAPISKGQDAHQTLEKSAQLALYAESLGYSRYWFAEHHGTRGLASTAPEILMSHIAAKTSSIRVGSGGVLLPQYSPFKIAEVFQQLEALYPGRIDLGIGRSPGGPEKIRRALGDTEENGLKAYPRKLQDVIHHLHRTLPGSHLYNGIKVAPLTDKPPTLWTLGLGENSASLAASHGVGYVFGHFISPNRGVEALKTYKTSFKPSVYLQNPASIVAVFIICGESDEEAELLASSQDLWLLQVEKGLDSRVPRIEEAKAYHYTERDQEKIRQNRKRMIIGSRETVTKELFNLMNRYGADEVMALANIYDFEEKKKSFKRLAELFL